MTEKTIGLFIDGDNAHQVHLPEILEHLSKNGRVVVKRVYGDCTESQFNRWNEVTREFGLEQVHCPNLPKKNSSDLKLCDDIYELAYEQPHIIDIYAIMSSDSDFSIIARRLRRLGKYVIGFGYQNTSPVLRSSVDIFVCLASPKSIMEKKRKLEYEEVDKTSGRKRLNRKKKFPDSDDGT